VTLALNANAIVLIVQDNGCGFVADSMCQSASVDPDRIEAGHGIPNIKLRLAEIHGTCQIQSAPQAGTTVKFEVPIQVHSLQN
jgi:signal transduction histidine kinase